MDPNDTNSHPSRNFYRFDSVMDMLQEFYALRMKMYIKRKEYLEGMLQAEADRLSNQARFIMEKCSGELVVENKKRKTIIDELLKKNYKPDPVKEWKECCLQEEEEEAQPEENDDDDEQDSEKKKSSGVSLLLVQSNTDKYVKLFIGEFEIIWRHRDTCELLNFDFNSSEQLFKKIKVKITDPMSWNRNSTVRECDVFKLFQIC